jgi:hypothetical protein
MSVCLYLNLLALHRRIPSIIEAWFNSSEITASSGPSKTSNNPALASKQLAYKIVSSLL